MNGARALDRLREVVLAEPLLMRVLWALRVEMPDAMVAGGAVRGLVWDDLHGFSHAAPRDVDVVYFDAADVDRGLALERLRQRVPDVVWDVKNQARVRDIAPTGADAMSLADAVGSYTETANCVAVRLLDDDSLDVLAPFGLHDLFDFALRCNPRVDHRAFERRLAEKRYLERWPRLRVVPSAIGEVCSGAQTGVDFGSLCAAESRGVRTGGVMPKGCRTNRGPKPEWAARFGLTEHHRAGYPARTRANVERADATVRIAKNFMSTGERCTLAACAKIGRMPLDITVLRVGGELTVDRVEFNAAVETLRVWARDMGRPLVVNFAGNSEETCPGIAQLAERVVGAMLDGLLRGA